MNFTEVFEEKVVNYFIDEYFKGRTINPCIACNKYVKFDALLKKQRQQNMWQQVTMQEFL